MGEEVMGAVLRSRSEVNRFQVIDRVANPFTIACARATSVTRLRISVT